MSIIESTSDDGSLDSAVTAILGKLQMGNEPERKDTRENREDADITELETSTDLDEAEREEREAKANEQAKTNGKAPAEVEGKDASEGDAEDDAQFIEVPPAEDGGEPTRVPVAKAIEAFQKLSQMDGEIATAVIRAEEEAYQKHDEVTQALAKTFETVEKQAKLALEMMYAYAPAEPHPRSFNSTEDYYQAKLDYDGWVAHYNKVAATLKQAESGLGATTSQQDTEIVRREIARTERFIPGWSDPKTRAAKQQEIVDMLGPKYGIKMDDVSEITDHRALRIIHDLTQSLKQAKAAPEVRKQITETKPKIVNGRVSPDRDPSTGRFLGEARKELRDTGSEDSFVRMLMRSGSLKGL